MQLAERMPHRNATLGPRRLPCLFVSACARRVAGGYDESALWRTKKSAKQAETNCDLVRTRPFLMGLMGLMGLMVLMVLMR